MTSLMITTVCLHSEQMQIHHARPLCKNSRDSMSSHVCLFIIYLSPDIQEVASQASHKSSCPSGRHRVSLPDFQLLLVNQNSIL